MFIKHYIASEVSLQRWRAALPEDLQGCYSVNTCEGGGWRGGSGEWPLRYVLFRQVVVQVSSHSADSHTRRVTGTAVWDRKTEWGKFEDQQNTKTTVIKCSSRVQLNKSLFLLWSQLSLTNINSSHLLSSHLTNVGRSRNRLGYKLRNWEDDDDSEQRTPHQICLSQTDLEVFSPSSSLSCEAAALPAARLRWSERWCSLRKQI